MDRLTRRSYSYTGTSTAVSLETTRVDYAYDSCGSYTRGRLCSVTAKKGSTTEVSRTAYNRYDALGRVLESTQTTGGQAYTMAYSYDRAGNLIRQRYPSERVVDYVYDGAGRIAGAKTGIDDWYAGGTGSNAVDYEPHGGVKQLLLGNGLWEQRRYNARLQPTQIGLGTTTATGGTLVATGTTPSAGLLLLDYSYGASSNNGNVLSQRIRVGTSLNQNQVYTYDALNRQKTAGETGSGTAWSQTYTYDRYGNRRVTAGTSHGSNQALTPQSTADIAAGTNRLAGLKGVNAVTYDAAGNLKADWAANAFKYDGDNRLVAFDAPLGTDSDTAYAYDGEGRRVRKVVGGASGITTTYVYNVGGQLVAEFGGTASEQPGTRYLTPDPLGSTRLVTAEDQSVLTRHDYLPFGEEIGAAYGGRSSVSGYTASLADGPAQKFTGKERDNESQLDYFGARYFSGAGGRFTSVDPYEINQEVARAESQDQREELLNGYIGNPQGWNRYSYVRNNPLAMIDPDGRDALWVVDKRTSQTTLRIPVKFVGAGATKQNVDTIVKRVNSLNLGGSPVRLEVIPTNKPINGVLNTMDFSPGLDMKNYPVGEGTNQLGGNKAHIDSSVPSGTDAAAHDILHFAGIDDQYREEPRDSSGNRTTTPRPGYNKTNIMTSRSGTNLKPRQIQEAYANRSTKDCTTEQDGRTTCR